MTTVDPPELVRHIIRQYDYVIYDMPDGDNKLFAVSREGKPLRKTERIPEGTNESRVIHFGIPALPMRKLIVKKQFPPTRLIRYCCEDLKEPGGVGRVVVTGVRWAESRNRKQNQGIATIFSGEARKVAEEQGANFTGTVRGGGPQFGQRGRTPYG